VSQDLQQKLSWRFGGRDLEQALTEARHQAVSVDSALRPEQVERLRALPTEIDKMDFFRALSLEILKDHPGHYLRMCWERLVQTLWFDPTNPRSFVMAYRLPYVVLASLALLGIVLASVRRTAYWLTAAAFPFGLFAVFISVVTSARFRLMIEAACLLPAAFALWWSWERRPRFGGRKRSLARPDPRA